MNNCSLMLETPTIISAMGNESFFLCYFFQYFHKWIFKSNKNEFQGTAGALWDFFNHSSRLFQII